MISVIIPTYNEEKNIENCLKSLLNQTLPRDRYEIIVVDGQSKDNTVKLAKKYADKVIQQKSKGVGGARNDGVKLSKYDLIATTDADCLVPKNWLKEIVSSFNKDKKIVCVYGPLTPIEKQLKYKLYLGINNIFAYIFYKFAIIYLSLGANTSFRKRDFLEVGGYADYSAGDDYELPFRLRKKGKIFFNRKLFVCFSMRRFELFGIINSLFMWFNNAITDFFKINKKVYKYNKIDYESLIKIKKTSKNKSNKVK